MITKIKSHLFPIIILIFLSIIAHHVWFSNLSPITYGDWTVDSIEKTKEHFSLPHIWFTDSGLGGINIGISFWPFLFLSGILAKLNFDVYFGERLIFLWPIVLLIPISMYFFSYYIFRSKTAAFISALVFEFNTYLIILKGGHITILMAIAFIPFFLLYFIKTLVEKKLSYVLVTSIFAFIISFYEFRIFYLVVLLALFYTIYYLFIIERVKNTYQLIKLGFLSAIPVLLVLLLNFYFLIGVYKAQSLVSNSIFSQPLFGAWYIKLINMFTIRHFGWTGEQMKPWSIQPIQWYFFLVPILAFLGFLLNKKNRYVLFFAFIGILGIFFAKQNTVPLPNIYQWLFDTVPGFNAFRESGKFLIYVSLSYSILIGAFISWLWQNAHKNQRLLAFLITGATAILFLWNSKPMITGEFGQLLVQRKIPIDYLTVKNFLSNSTEYFRTLWIPTFSRWSFRLNNIPLMSNYNLANGDWISYGDNIKPIYSRNFTNQLFDLTSIKYVIIPLEDKVNDDNFFEYLGKRKSFIDQIDKLNYLKRIKIGTKDIVIYENEDYRSHIYLTSQKETIYKNIPYQKINFQYKSPTEYKIYLKKLTKPVYLNFSESYHPDWKLRTGKFNWFKVLTNKNYFLPDKNHFQNDAGLNSFYLNPKDLCNNTICSNVNLTLYFRPQSYVYLGGIISLITLTAIVSCLFYRFGKEIYQRFSLYKKSSPR